MPHLLVFRKNRFWRVHRGNGSFKKLGEPVWEQITHLTTVGDLAYAVERGHLHRVDPESGRWGIVGRKFEYMLTTALFGHRDLLYAVHHERLWRINPDDGSSEQFGGHIDWPGEIGDVRIVGAGDFLLGVQGEKLWLTDPVTGRYKRISAPYGWVDTTDICSDGERVYTIRRGQLWEVRPEDGAQRLINEHRWRGNAIMAADEQSVFVIHRNMLWRVDVQSGEIAQLSKPWEWPGVSHMVMV